MARIFIRTISYEEAKGTLDFFEKNPHRDNCIVGLGDGEDAPMIQHTRADIPKLQRIVDESPPSRT
jgi:hypothetical protein